MTRLVFTVTNDLSYDQRMQRIGSTLSAAGLDCLLTGFVKPASVPLGQAPYRQERLGLRFTRGKLFYLEYNARLYRHLVRVRPDIIVSIDLDTLPAGYAASRSLGCPLVLDAHEYFSELPEVVSRPLIHAFWSRLEASLLPRVLHNYTVSASVGRALQERYGQPFAVFPNYPRCGGQGFGRRAEEPAPTAAGLAPAGGSPAAAGPAPDAPQAARYALYQGALNRGRGIEAAMQAFDDLPLALHIAGEGDLSQELRQRNSSARFLGYLQPEALREHTRGAWLGLNLLDNLGLSYYYSLSNKFFDYIRAGIPQLCMDFPEYRAINERWEVAVLLPRAEPEAIRRAVRELLQDPERYRRLQANCLEAREALCWERVEPELLAFYQRVLEQPDRPAALGAGPEVAAAAAPDAAVFRPQSPAAR